MTQTIGMYSTYRPFGCSVIQSQFRICSPNAASNPAGQSGRYSNSAGAPPTASFQASTAARAAAWCSSPSTPNAVVANEQTVLGPPFQNVM